MLKICEAIVFTIMIVNICRGIISGITGKDDDYML